MEGYRLTKLTACSVFAFFSGSSGNTTRLDMASNATQTPIAHESIEFALASRALYR